MIVDQGEKSHSLLHNVMNSTVKKRPTTCQAPAHLGQIRHLMKKTPNGQFLSGAFALSLAALLAACRSTSTQIAPELKSLQGYWQGEGGAGSISINITGNSLNYYARPDQWFKTTFTLPAGTDPKQLLATIKDCGGESPKPIGEVVASIYKIEEGTLTFASPPSHNAKAPKSFEDEAIGGIFAVRKVQPQKRITEPLKTKATKDETRQREQITGSAWVLEPGLKHAAEMTNIASVSELYSAPIVFQNNSAGLRKVYWLDYNGERQRYCELKPGENCELGTFLTHPWVVTDAQGKALSLYYPDGQKRTVTLE